MGMHALRVECHYVTVGIMLSVAVLCPSPTCPLAAGGIRSAFRTLRQLFPTFHTCTDISEHQLASAAAIAGAETESEEGESETEDEELSLLPPPLGGIEEDTISVASMAASASGLHTWPHGQRPQRATRCVQHQPSP